ncbi:hypothetical protein [Candidatus Entotheonella palauensis]|uniref:Uncharacterized protein n=1 Tax=Candidatus Entotheonella gemina TaxID=1429439 RepID=W4MG20_9BACT|nr:hypothetical protein [Candidatus Entotheonella palauensis]ETX09153.1 MAG: hypothetical protein ETSY2_01165 [Candidatus Entotheonella gemina]
MQPPLLTWFINSIEAFAPPEGGEARQKLYADLIALQPEPPATFKDHIALFVLAQVLAARQLALPKHTGKVRRGSTSHETWYSKERQRISKLLLQIEESPIVADFQATVRYYGAEEVTCPHGRNQKTCDALYALQLTLTLLERYPPPGGGRKQIERLRQLEPHLPPLQELCIPQPFEPPSEAFSWIDQERAPRTLEWLTEDTVTYLLSTVVNRLRQFGVTVAQSCDVVDRILTFCFDQPDGEAGERPARLAQQWRRLH